MYGLVKFLTVCNAKLGIIVISQLTRCFFFLVICLHLTAPYEELAISCCRFLKGRKFPGTVRLTRTGDERQPDSSAERSDSAAAKDSKAGQAANEAATSEVEDRQARSLHGEPSTSQQVIFSTPRNAIFLKGRLCPILGA
jgi:hypothetical protein